MANQNSIITYVPQPYFIEGSCIVRDYVDITSIENGPGIFNPDLADYATIVPDSGVNEFGIQIIYDRSSAYLSAIDVSAAFIGCSLMTYEDDGGSPNLDTGFNEDIICAMGSSIGTNGDQLMTFAHSSQNEVNTFCKEPMPGIISGGQTNLLFHGLGTSRTTTTVAASIIFVRAAADVAARPHARLIIGHFFVGIDLPIIIDPRSFSWHLSAENERFLSRDFGSISSEGTLVRRATGEIIKIANNAIVGLNVTETTNDLVPNFFDMTKAGNSYPMLLSPYPMPAIGASGITAEEANGTARQNFFSIYGFMEDTLEFQTGEFRDGLNSEFKARFRMRETR